MTANKRTKTSRLTSVQTLHVPWRWHHYLAGPFVALLLYLDAQAPGILGDLNVLVLTNDWHVTLGLRVGLVVLCMVAYFFIRSYHPLTGVALLGTLIGQALRLGNTQAIEEPLTLGTLVLIVAMAMVPMRVIVRPNEMDLRAHVEAQERGEP